VEYVHPNLRGARDEHGPGTARRAAALRFTALADLESADVIVCALPHGVLAGMIDQVDSMAGVLVDLSSDFRLSDPRRYERHYGHAHARPDLLGSFVYANPELNTERLRGATRLAGAGCIATATL